MKRHIRNPSVFAAKMEAIRAAGVDQLHIIADFDRTISHPQSDSSWSLLKRFKFPQSFHDALNELFVRFHKGEKQQWSERVLTRSCSGGGHDKVNRGTTGLDGRSKKAFLLFFQFEARLLQWWRLSHEILLGQKVTKATFIEGVKEFGSHMYFRERTHELINTLREKRIPLLVLSAGLGDLIDAVIAREGANWDNVHVVSNHLVFGADGVATRFATKNITTFTKNEVIITEVHPTWEKVSRRGFVLSLFCVNAV